MIQQLAEGLSIIIPVYRSQETLENLTDQITQEMLSIGTPFEIILVNDGSPDNSWHVIEMLAARNAHILGLSLIRNFGQHNALLCGIRAARYDKTITMDDDLQHPPSEIPALLNKLQEGYDVVYGVPRELPHSLWRNIVSKYSKIFVAAAGLPNVRHLSAFRAFRTHLRVAFEHYQGSALLLDVLLSWATTRFTFVQVQHQPRKVGTSNYTLSKLFNQLMLLLTGFSIAPLRLAIFVGFIFTLFGIGVLIYTLVAYFSYQTVPGFAFFASLISLFSGAQLFAIGIIGEYVGRIFNRSLGRPAYVVQYATHETDTNSRSRNNEHDEQSYIVTSDI